MLGGSLYQVYAIKEAVKMGYYVITCDYLPNNPGHQYAHEYYNVSTTDKEAIYELAKRLQVDGVVAYASDPAAPTAAYVCEKLGLPTSPYTSVEILSQKDLFRRYLAEHDILRAGNRSGAWKRHSYGSIHRRYGYSAVDFE